MNLEHLASRLSVTSIGPAAFGIALLGGLVAGLGPCVLPMLPAVFGYVTGTVAKDEADRPMLRGLVLTTAFVLGMSVVFAVVGAIAGLLGKALLMGAWAYYVAAAICAVIGLQMLGLLEIPVEGVNRWLPTTKPKRGGLSGAVLFGMLFGLVASPCSTPILAAIATIAASTGSAVTGAALLFVYGIGKGVPLLALGVASGSLSLMRSLSRATAGLTRLGGVGLLAAAVYLVWLA